MATPSNPKLREINFLKAQLADEAGRHDHTVRFMVEIAKSVTPVAELSPSERKLLCTALKKFLDDHRQAWYEVNSRSVNWVGVQSEVAKFYLKRIAAEISNVCREIMLLINRQLIPSARSAESMVSYLTFKGDLISYIAELEENEEEEAVLSAILAYKQAKGFQAIAKAELTWQSPARLTLALKASEFYSEIMQLQEKGAKVATKALENAIKAGADRSDGEFNNEINELIEKLRQNIATWTDNEQNEEAGTSTPRPQLVAGTSLTQVDSPPEIGGEAGASGTNPDLQAKPAGRHLLD